MSPSILDLDATALRDAIRSGEVSALEAARTYLERIQALNPHLHAVITVNPEAEADAARLDTLPPEVRGPLHGVPLLIKDNIDVAGLPTTAGSLLMTRHVPAVDAPLVARLRAAGAVLLGKANLTEWANFMTLGMPNGYSGAGGQTVNPWGPALDTGGSSSGSGVAVAARLCAAAVGTETSGSILSPAQQNGVIGLKPTVALIPRTGVVPISHSQDTAGPIARSVRDAALLLTVMAGPDEADAASRLLPVPDLTLHVGALTGAQIGVLRVPPGALVSDAERGALARAEAALTEAGATLQDVTLESGPELSGWRLEVLVYEFKHDLNAYLAGVQDGPRSLAEVIEANDADPERLQRYGQTLLYAAEGTRGDLSERAYQEARARDLDQTRTRGLDPLFALGLDALLWPGLHGYAVGAKAGYPSVTVPTGLEEGAPSGVLLTAPAGSEGQLLSLAAGLEERLGGVAFPPDPA
ncbi:amidase family protein [Deinococcus hopiensis]|uniref:Amidase n=1 Tax=Deinococcus hopiensis KR-140 TaxID=695939 RepID=A0A1W1VK65_9DEIO|nr:amidase family protein [Deinococcus hopiensis]SMB93706.1 amidase [Deinococcus hopiensis KR-140]